ncbi:MAG: ABC transporter ATP-binding protein [Solirubrobacteraceae bacterium]
MTLALRDLVKHYALGDSEPVRAVDGVSFQVAAGELVALYGPSGSGKSTLLALVAGLLAPDSGSVLVDGRELAVLSDSELAAYRLREIGLVDRRAILLPGGTTVQNAAMKLWMTGGTRAAQKRVVPLLRELGLGERLAHRGEQLSMGERQRVAIARALSTEPKLILADEPTGSLDSRRGREVLELLAGRCTQRGAAVLLVTHDPQATALADRVLAMRDGRVAEHDVEDVLMASGLRKGERSRL